MGFYINALPNGTRLPATGKAEKLLTIPGAKEIDTPKKWKENIVCVVDNMRFEAAGYAYNEDELDEFKRFDGRPRRWLVVPGADVLSEYKK